VSGFLLIGLGSNSGMGVGVHLFVAAFVTSLYPTSLPIYWKPGALSLTFPSAVENIGALVGIKVLHNIRPCVD
jgi:hypothetical protein